MQWFEDKQRRIRSVSAVFILKYSNFVVQQAHLFQLFHYVFQPLISFKISDSSLCLEHYWQSILYRKNFIHVNLFYRELNYLTIEEQKAYEVHVSVKLTYSIMIWGKGLHTISLRHGINSWDKTPIYRALVIFQNVQFLSDIGGTLGLWVGISLLTIVEVMQLGSELLSFLCKKYYKNKQVSRPETPNSQRSESGGFEPPQRQQGHINKATVYGWMITTYFVMICILFIIVHLNVL